MNTETFGENVDRLSDERLTALKNRIEIILHVRDRDMMSKTMTAAQLGQLYSKFGYVIPTTSKFWKITAPGRGRGLYGLQVGRYTHQCHIDTTDMIVVLVVGDNGQTFVEAYADLWLTDCVTL